MFAVTKRFTKKQKQKNSADSRKIKIKIKTENNLQKQIKVFLKCLKQR